MALAPRTQDILHKGGVLALVTVPLLGAVLAMALAWQSILFPRDLLILAVFQFLAALGVTIGYHRMLTHRGFEAPAMLRGFLLICGSMAFEGAPDVWAATHTKHHAHSDDEGDPHSPLEGFWHAHFGWLFSRQNFPDVKAYAPHLLEDPVVVFVSRTTPLWMLLSGLVPFLLGGWTGLLWGGVVRVFLTTHVTWSVNSVCHTFGKRVYETTDESRNNWIIGLLAFGEGWHNNHHAFPSNAFHGMRWWQFDLSGYIIRALEKTGLIWDVQRVTRETEEQYSVRLEKSRHLLARMREQLRTAIDAAEQELEWVVGSAIGGTDGEYVASCKAGLARLRELRNGVVFSLNAKRVRLMQSMKEVQLIVERARSRAPAPA